MFPKFHVQDHWLAPRSTQPFILQRSIKWAPGISGNLVVKVTCLIEVALKPWGSWNPSIKRGYKVFLKKIKSKLLPSTKWSALLLCSTLQLCLKSLKVISATKWLLLKMCHLRRRLRIFLFHRKIMFRSQDV